MKRFLKDSLVLVAVILVEVVTLALSAMVSGQLSLPVKRVLGQVTTLFVACNWVALHLWMVLIYGAILQIKAMLQTNMTLASHFNVNRPKPATKTLDHGA